MEGSSSGACGKGAYLFNRILAISSLLETKGCMELSSISCAEIGVPIDFSRVSQGISGVAQRKPIQLSSMMGNMALL